MSAIRKFLDLSTVHLPQRFFNDPTGEDFGIFCKERWGTVVYELEHGALLWVPDDPNDSSEHGQEEPTAPEVLAIQLYARSLGCDYVLFDSDGPKDAGLPTFEESWEG